jgi:hypothetical protein
MVADPENINVRSKALICIPNAGSVPVRWSRIGVQFGSQVDATFTKC